MFVAIEIETSYVGDRASQLDLERLRQCGRIVLGNLENLRDAFDDLMGGTLEQEVNHFEARLIAQALEQENGSITRAAQALGLTRQACQHLERSAEQDPWGSS